jgi:hypothetical protein
MLVQVPTAMAACILVTKLVAAVAALSALLVLVAELVKIVKDVKQLQLATKPEEIANTATQLQLAAVLVEIAKVQVQLQSAKVQVNTTKAITLLLLVHMQVVDAVVAANIGMLLLLDVVQVIVIKVTNQSLLVTKPVMIAKHINLLRSEDTLVNGINNMHQLL